MGNEFEETFAAGAVADCTKCRWKETFIAFGQGDCIEWCSRKEVLCTHVVKAVVEVEDIFGTSR